MKSQRRFWVVLLALALAVSCFAVMAFAEEKNYNYLDMLEYYEGGYYLNEQFDGEGELFADRGSELVVPDSGYSCTVSDGKGAFAGTIAANVITVVPTEAGSFGLNLKGKNVAGGRGASVRLQLVKENTDFDVLDVFEISNGTLEYADASFDTASGTVVNNPLSVTGEAFANGTEFTVDFYYNGTDATLNISGTDYDVSLAGYEFSEIKLIFLAAEFDYIEMYRGSFQRRLADREDTVAEYILAIKNGQQSNAALEAVAKIYGFYGFDSSKMSDQEKAAEVDEFAVSALQSYSNSVAFNFVEGADVLAATTDYTSVKNLVAVLTDYDTVISNVENNFADTVTLSISADVIEAKREILSDAAEWLVTAKENTISSIALLDEAPDVFTATYKQLYTFYQKYKEAPICETYFDDEYSAQLVKSSFDRAELLKNEFLRVDAMAKVFSENAPIAANEALSFGERYVAYAAAKENVFNDATYNEFLNGVTVEQLNVMYNEAASALTARADYASKFLTKMNEANSTRSYSVMQSTLDEAEAYLEDVEPTYPGVAEAKELYTVLRNKISEAKTAAEEYINAVLAVQAAKTVAEKKAAIATAKEKAVLGSDVSLEVSVGDVTVSGANVILSNEESKITLAEVKNGNFITAVNAIADATDVAEKRTAILKAVNLRTSVDESSDDVKEAVSKLEAAMDAYDAEVEAANATAKVCNDAAAATVEKTVLTKVAADIVAIIKKFF